MNEEWSGERLETFVLNEATIEHLHRYALAQALVKGKTVLDMACGEGYGAALLSQNASAVTGMDIDAATIKKAAAKYRKRNLDFDVAPATSIPAADGAFDVVVSFETLEHVADHGAMMREIKRVLKPGGLLLISTPDKKSYSDEAGFRNPHHVKELYEAEFRKLLSDHFANFELLGQSFAHGSLIAKEGKPENFSVQTGDFDHSSSQLPKPLYWIALASDAPLPPAPSGFFYSPEAWQAILASEADAVKKTLTYRLGHFLLRPFKILRGRKRP